MTKIEFLERLSKGLERGNIPDAEDIVEEYEQHFAFKIADGYSEEEISAKLGEPAALAAQFDAVSRKKGRAGRKLAAASGLGLTGILAAAFFAALAAFGIGLAAFALCCAAAAVCMAAGVNPLTLIPPMPGASAVIFGIAMAALAVLSAAGCVYFASFLRQLTRGYGRFHRNTMAAAAGKPALPSVPVYPGFKPRVKRGLRLVALVSLCVFAALAVAGCAVSIILSGSIEFWHAWGWFGFAA